MLLDKLDAKKVDITVDSEGKLWVNVDDKCVIRIGHCELVLMDDPIRGQDVVYEAATSTFKKGGDEYAK